MKGRENELGLLSERIANVINGFTYLTEEEKMLVIKKIDKKVPIALIQFYNTLNDYIL